MIEIKAECGSLSHLAAWVGWSLGIIKQPVAARQGAARLRLVRSDDTEANRPAGLLASWLQACTHSMYFSIKFKDHYIDR